MVRDIMNDATTNIFINEFRMLQRTQMLQRTRRNTIGRRSTRVRMTCRAFPLWLKHKSSSFLSFVGLSYQFCSFICLFAPLAEKIIFKIILLYNFMESSITVFTRERLFMLFMCVSLFMLFIRERLFIVFTKERLLMLFKFTCAVYKI